MVGSLQCFYPRPDIAPPGPLSGGRSASRPAIFDHNAAALEIILVRLCPGETRAHGLPPPQVIRCRETPITGIACCCARAASGHAAAPPSVAKNFLVRCGLPCDPSAGGHSCNGGMIPRFHRAVCTDADGQVE